MKGLVLKIDRLIFNGFLYQSYMPIRAKIKTRFLQDILSYGFAVQYQKYDNSVVNSLCDKYGSDKGEVAPGSNPYPHPSHNYADFYSLIFGLRRNDVKRVVECGLGTNNPDITSTMGLDGKPGASLRVWRDYFTTAEIVGCDIDRDILFSDDRIKTFQCDQRCAKSIHEFIKCAELSDNSVDIIIDDGLHEFHAGKCFFENMIPSLRLDGLYIIEDVTHDDVLKYKEYFLLFSERYEVKFVFLKSPYINSGHDNNLICVTKKTDYF